MGRCNNRVCVSFIFVQGHFTWPYPRKQQMEEEMLTFRKSSSFTVSIVSVVIQLLLLGVGQLF